MRGKISGKISGNFSGKISGKKWFGKNGKNGKKWKLFLLLIIVYPYKNSSQMSILKNFWKNFWPLYEKNLMHSMNRMPLCFNCNFGVYMNNVIPYTYFKRLGKSRCGLGSRSRFVSTPNPHLKSLNQLRQVHLEKLQNATGKN